jgi:hypothetical protein
MAMKSCSRRPTRRKVEDAIQKELIRWIKETYPHVMVFATRNEDSYKRSDEIEAGLPDIIIRWPHGDTRYFLYFEVKTKAGRLSASQKKWAEKDRCANELYAVGYGLEDCKKEIAALL